LLPPFEILDHTADIGLRARGASLPELFVNAALGLESIALDTDQLKATTAFALSATGEDTEALLVNWLNEIIYFLDGQRVAFSCFAVDDINDRSITAKGWGEPRDFARHPARLVVKAATYHQLKLASGHDGWTAEIFFDI
jgi:SHS2 domain-containing protein